MAKAKEDCMLTVTCTKCATQFEATGTVLQGAAEAVMELGPWLMPVRCPKDECGNVWNHRVDRAELERTVESAKKSGAVALKVAQFYPEDDEGNMTEVSFLGRSGELLASLAFGVRVPEELITGFVASQIRGATVSKVRGTGPLCTLFRVTLPAAAA